MNRADFVKEGFNIATRIAFAALALLVVIASGTLGVVIEGLQARFSPLLTVLTIIGSVATAAVLLVLLGAAWKGLRLFRRLEQLVSEED